jgi:uncharacterized membrane protein YfcA
MTALVPVAVGLVALVYAMVGHAGATGYIAVLAIAGVAPGVIRPTALLLNVVVAAIGTVQFARAGHFRPDVFWPLAAASVPAAFLGGTLALPTAIFEAVVGVVLLVAATQLVAATARAAPEPAGRRPTPAALGAIGAGIGLLSGLTGVGGGVFLSPVLLALRAASVRGVAAVAAPFILVNSLAGLAGGAVTGAAWPPVMLWVVAAVIGGGTVGSQLGAFRLPVRALRIVLAVVLVAAAWKLLAAASEDCIPYLTV